MTQRSSRLKKGGVATAVGLLAISFVGAWEGYSSKTYRDIVGVPTVCYGETRGIKMGMSFTKAECDKMLLDGLLDFERGVLSCVEYPMTDHQLVASVSLAYNIGTRAYCRSSVARLFNSGRPERACNAILAFNRAGGKVVRGLVRRREAERDLCMKRA